MTERLPRVVGPVATALFVVGYTIGSGIFRLPAEVASKTGTPTLMLLWWLLGALFALAGAFCFAELGSRLPRSGGEFAYLNAAFGPSLAFLFGWCNLVLSGPASIAAVARTFADYGAALLPMSEWTRRIVAAALIVLHALIVLRSTRGGARVVSIATVGKLVAIGVVIVTALAFPAAPGALEPAVADGTGVPATSLALGFTAIIFAYKGFQSVAMLGGEVRDPQRSIPLGVIGGTALVGLIYVLLNFAFTRVLGFAQVQASTAVAADTMRTVFGDPGARFVSALVLVATFGTVAAQMMAFPRLAYAMAQEGVFFRRFATLSRWETPSQAVGLVAGMALVLVLTGSYAALIRLAVLSLYPLTAVALCSAVVLRRREGPPAWEMPLYPLPLVLFVATVVVVSVFSLLGDPRAFALSVGATLAGYPIYLVWTRRFREAGR